MTDKVLIPFTRGEVDLLRKYFAIIAERSKT